MVGIIIGIVAFVYLVGGAVFGFMLSWEEGEDGMRTFVTQDFLVILCMWPVFLMNGTISIEYQEDDDEGVEQ